MITLPTKRQYEERLQREYSLLLDVCDKCSVERLDAIMRRINLIKMKIAKLDVY